MSSCSQLPPECLLLECLVQYVYICLGLHPYSMLFISSVIERNPQLCDLFLIKWPKQRVRLNTWNLSWLAFICVCLLRNLWVNANKLFCECTEKGHTLHNHCSVISFTFGVLYKLYHWNNKTTEYFNIYIHKKIREDCKTTCRNSPPSLLLFIASVFDSVHRIGDSRKKHLK